MDIMDGYCAGGCSAFGKRYRACGYPRRQGGRYSNLGAALSATETLVSIHAMTMLIDILAQTQIEQMAVNPYIE